MRRASGDSGGEINEAIGGMKTRAGISGICR
jgi:hypothetical protein